MCCAFDGYLKKKNVCCHSEQQQHSPWRSGLIGCVTVLFSEWFLTLKTNAVPSYSRVQQSKIPKDEGTSFLQNFRTIH